MNQSLTRFSQAIQTRQTTFAPYGNARGRVTAAELGYYITPVQFERIRHDMASFRAAIIEAEQARYPQRVKMQRLYIDVIEDLYVRSVVEAWKSLTLQRKYCVYQMKGSKKEISTDLSQALEEQSWVSNYISSVLNAPLFGYELITMGNIENDTFPEMGSMKRQNIRPDGIFLGDNKQSGPVLTSLVYGIDGIHLEQDDPRIPLFNHYIPTPPNAANASVCGYGALYNIAQVQIMLRNIQGWNTDFVMRYGMPLTKGYTNKTDKERQEFGQLIANMGSNPWIILDPKDSGGDEVEFEQANGGVGTGWKGYSELRNWGEGLIAQGMLGHTDCMKSLPGKLGGMQAANKDGFNESLIEQAMNNKQNMQARFLMPVMNHTLAPALRKLGRLYGSNIIKNLIPEGYFFDLHNDREKNEIKRRKASHADVALGAMQKGYNAGIRLSKNGVAQLSEELGYEFEQFIPAKEQIRITQDAENDKEINALTEKNVEQELVNP